MEIAAERVSRSTSIQRALLVVGMCLGCLVCVAPATAAVGDLTPFGCVGEFVTGPPGCIGDEGLENPNFVTVSPDGKNVYVTSFISSAVVQFERVAGGGLRPIGCVGNTGVGEHGPPGCIGSEGLDDAHGLAVSPDGKNAYVSSVKSNAVVLFERVSGGGLKPIGCVGNTGGKAPGPPSCIGSEGLEGAESIAVSPDGANVYVASGASNAVVQFERVTGGGLKPLGCVGNIGGKQLGPPSCIGSEGLEGADSIAVSPDGQNVYVVSEASKAVVLFERVAGGGLKPMGCVGNTGTGPPSCIGSDGLDRPESVAVSPDGRNVYVASGDNLVLFERVAGGGLKPIGCVGNSGTGAPSCIGSEGLAGADSVAVSPDGRNVYVAGSNSNAVVVFERFAGGGLRPMGCIGNVGTGPPGCIGSEGLTGASSIVVSPDGADAYATSATKGGAVVLFSRVTPPPAPGGGGPGPVTGKTTPNATTVATIGNRQLTLTIAGAGSCLVRPGPLRAQLGSSVLAGSKAPALRFRRAAVFIDRGVKHKHHRTVRRHGRRVTITTITYTPNAVVTTLPVGVSLRLAGLASGTHTLRVVYHFQETIRRHGRRVTVPVVKTQTLKFMIC
jgi:DNA-binding beta-propeller fold protein YncE